MTREEFLKDFPKLIGSYQPAAVETEKLKDVSLLMIIGPSGVGKTTLIKELEIPYVAADTTRLSREGEVNGVDYHFRTDYDRIIEDIQNGRFVNVAVGPSGDFYATRATAYPPNGYAVYAIVSDVIPYFRHLGFARTISAFIVPPSFEEWMRRMGAHHLVGNQLEGRLAEARRSLDFGLNDKDTNFILNDDVDKAVSQIKGLLGGNIDRKREELAKKAAQESLSRISR